MYMLCILPGIYYTVLSKLFKTINTLFDIYLLTYTSRSICHDNYISEMRKKMESFNYFFDLTNSMLKEKLFPVADSRGGGWGASSPPLPPPPSKKSSTY